MHHWHWLIVIYLFLGGLGAGTYLTSFAAEKGWLGNNSHLKRAGYYLAAPIVAFGTILLVFDLGQGLHKPWLLIRLLFNLGSVMTWGVYILSAFIIVGLIKGYLVFKNKTAPGALTWAGAVLALATCAYTGLLVAVVEAVPFWNTMLMPFLFVASALSTGLSLTALIAHFIENEGHSSIREGQAHLGIIAVELVIVAMFFGIMVSGAKGSAGVESAYLALFGPYAPVFWGYFIVLGLLLPLVVFGREYLKNKQFARTVTTEPSSIRIETAATAQGHQASFLNLATDVSVLVGGLALRALIIFVALPVWDGRIL